MRRLLGTLAVLLTLAGCGDDTAVESPPAETPAVTPDVTLVHATAGGGDPEQRATDVTDDADLAGYVAQFDDALAVRVTRAAKAAGGETVLAQVVAVGCDVPRSAHVQGDVLVPQKVAKPMAECLAPVTTVGVAGVD